VLLSTHARQQQLQQTHTTTGLAQQRQWQCVKHGLMQHTYLLLQIAWALLSLTADETPNAGGSREIQLGMPGRCCCNVPL
jgi:hypothetical protein